MVNSNGLIIALLVPLLASVHVAKAIETDTPSTNLAALLQGGLALRSAGGSFRFGGFAIDQAPSGSALPDLSTIRLTADDGAVLWEIGEDRRILRAAEDYHLGIKFQVTALDPQQALRSASLDIAGATIGTRGDAHAELSMELLDNDGASLGSLLVMESSTAPRLIDAQEIRGPNQWTARLQINASGGSGTAALVLTDLETSFATVAIPEPSGIILVGISVGSLVLVFRRRRANPRLHVEPLA